MLTWGTCSHQLILNRKKEIASQAAWRETTGQSPYCLNIQHCAEPFCTFLLTKSKIGLKDQGRYCKRGFIELHYILKGLVAPAGKESRSVQINRQEAPALLHCFLGQICGWGSWSSRKPLSLGHCRGAREPSSGTWHREHREGFSATCYERKLLNNEFSFLWSWITKVLNIPFPPQDFIPLSVA